MTEEGLGINNRDYGSPNELYELHITICVFTQSRSNLTKRYKHADSCCVSIILFPPHPLAISTMIQRLISLPKLSDNLCLIAHTVPHKFAGHR